MIGILAEAAVRYDSDAVGMGYPAAWIDSGAGRGANGKPKKKKLPEEFFFLPCATAFEILTATVLLAGFGRWRSRCPCRTP